MTLEARGLRNPPRSKLRPSRNGKVGGKAVAQFDLLEVGSWESCSLRSFNTLSTSRPPSRFGRVAACCGVGSEGFNCTPRADSRQQGAKRSSAMIRKWACGHGYEVLTKMQPLLNLGPFRWENPRGRTFGLLAVRGSQCKEYGVWICCGAEYLGLFSNKVEVRWISDEPSKD